MRTETLVRMADQIAANCAGVSDDSAVARISQHLQAFWTPGMVDQLTAYVRGNPDDVDPRVTAALSRLVS